MAKGRHQGDVPESSDGLPRQRIRHPRTGAAAAGQRASVLAANLANADTPNFKARDIDFDAVLRQEQFAGALPLVATAPAHLQAGTGLVGNAELKYRNPFQPSLDGNTVEAPVEKAAFGENAVRYQASLMFISRRVETITSALTGQ